MYHIYVVRLSLPLPLHSYPGYPSIGAEFLIASYIHHTLPFLCVRACVCVCSHSHTVYALYTSPESDVQTELQKFNQINEYILDPFKLMRALPSFAHIEQCVSSCSLILPSPSTGRWTLLIICPTVNLSGKSKSNQSKTKKKEKPQANTGRMRCFRLAQNSPNPNPGEQGEPVALWESEHFRK